MSRRKSGVFVEGRFFKNPAVCQDEDRAFIRDEPDTSRSDIVNFYRGKNVLLTGSTGFVGKVVIENLLRHVPDIGCIYIMLREKKGKDIETRINETFDGDLYERLNRVNPKFRHKVIPIKGDLMTPGLGLDIEDRLTLTSKVNVILHCAATVRFDEALPKAFAINVLGTQELIKIARDCKNLLSFVHVSTAYAHCPRSEIKEEFYPTHVTPNELSEMLKNHTAEEIEEMTPKILGRWPNTYTFTKAIAENWLQHNCDGLPIGIFRPSIIVSTYKEPIRGWTDNFYGPAGICLAAGIGIMRVLHCNESSLADTVPVDYVVNALLAISYKTYLEKGNNTLMYNYVTSPQQPLTWKEYMHNNQCYGQQVPSSKAIWYYNFRLIKNYYLYLIYKVFLHYIPALIVDGFCLVTGKKAQMLNAYKKIHKFSSVISYFSGRQWNFSNNNIIKLWDELSDVDKKIFPFDMSEISWDYHSQMNILGLRTYVLKEDPSTIDKMLPKWKLMKLLDAVVTYIVYAIFFWIIYRVIMQVF